MDSRFKRMSTATALFVAFAIGQVYLTVGFAGSVSPKPNAVALPRAPGAILTTAGNKPISVNGANAITGATIISGALIETPDQVGADVEIPGQSRLQISAKTRLILTFVDNSTKVTLIVGCITLHTTKGTSGEVVNERGKELGKTAPTSDGELKFCEPRPSGGVSPGVIGLIGAGAAVGAIVALAGGGGGSTSSNPSPSGP